MNHPLQVTYLGFTHSAELEEFIRSSTQALETDAGNHLSSCHVFVECAHEHHDATRAYHARISLELPGGHLAVNHEKKHGARAHDDAFLAVRDAFEAATRQVIDWKRRRYGDT